MYERTGEHWRDVRCNSVKSHMIRHQQLVHQGAAPNFVMRAVKFYRTALSRQIGEAMRTMRRGGKGMVLNSKSEFERYRIPRLQVEEQNGEELRKKEEQELEEDLNIMEEQSREWSHKKYEERRNNDPKEFIMETRSNKREQELMAS